MAARGYLGSGDLYIERLVGGVSQVLMGPYECIQFEIKCFKISCSNRMLTFLFYRR